MAEQTLRDALPWIDAGPVRAVNQRAAARLVDELRALGYDVVELEGERIVNHESLIDQFTAAFGIPRARARDWSSLAALRRPDLRRVLGERVALVWHRADHSAAFCLKCVVEAGWFVLEWARALSEAGPDGMELELFLLGQTRDFAPPPPGVGRA